MSNHSHRADRPPSRWSGKLRHLRWVVLLVAVLLVVPGAARPTDSPASALDGPAARGSRTPSPPATGAGSGPVAGAGADGVSATGEPPPAGASTDGARSTAADLERFLLRGSDLPPGWRTLPESIGLIDAALGDCLDEMSDPDQAPMKLDIVLQRGSDGPVVAAAVADYPDARAARLAFRSLHAAVTRCDLREGPVGTAAGVPGAEESLVAEVVLRRAGRVPGRLLAVRVGQRRATVLVLGTSRSDLGIASDALATMARRLG
jgi:hypothetical protein